MKRIFWIISILAWTAVLVHALLMADKYQWDFDVYYYAAKAQSAGLNPYDPYQLCELAGRWRPDILFFPYSPISIFLFKPFTFLSLEHAKYVFLLIKCGLLVYLFLLWQMKFLGNPRDPFFALFCLLGFNAAIFLDIRAGNVCVIEQALMWSAFLAFVSKRTSLFCVLILLSAVFKITPLAFAGLIFLDHGPFRNRAVVTLVSGAVIVGLLSWLVDPLSLWQFLHRASHWTEGNRFELGIRNPSTLSLVSFLSGEMYNATGIAAPRLLQWGIYLAIVIPIIAISCHTCLKLDMGDLDQRKSAVCFACLVYALVLPNFKDYQCILLLVPTYFIMLRLEFVGAYPVIFVLAVLSAEHQTLPGSEFLFRVLWNYHPLALALAVWVIYVKKIRRDLAEGACEASAYRAPIS